MQSTFEERTLMIPGPAEMDPGPLDAFARQTAIHYGPEWVAKYRDALDKVRQLFLTEGDTFLLFSSGTGGLEAGMASLLGPGDKLILAHNGFFAERLRKMGQMRGLEVIVVDAEWGQQVAPAAIKEAFVAHPDAAGLIAVHHETSTGVLNPIAEYGAIAREYDVPFIVDAIASWAGDPLRVDEWGIDICVSTGNKALGAAVSMSPIAVSPRVWRWIEENPPPAPGWYLNLATWKEYDAARPSVHPTPVTFSSQGLSAIHAAATEILAQGLGNRWEQFRARADGFRDEMKARGFGVFVEGDQASSVISVITRRPGMDLGHFQQYLVDEHNLQVSGGFGPLAGEGLRIGHMGPAGSPETIARFYHAVDSYKK